MTKSHLNTLKLVTLQNQLLLSIGGSLNAQEVMQVFMEAAYKKLGLKSIHFYGYDTDSPDSSEVQQRLSFPQDADNIESTASVQKILQQIKNMEVATHTSELPDDGELLAFAIDTHGAIIFEKHRGEFQESLKDAMVPVIVKLAEHYSTCERQAVLNSEIQVNKEAQRIYELQAKRDPLTNLPNRREFRYSLSGEISNSQRYNYYGALMYIDLDNFKNVNDSLGHSIGDILLTQVAQRLKAQARHGDNVFRIGGDEFVYILSNIGDTEVEAIATSKTVANRVIDTLSKPIEIGEFSLHITPSIGIAIYPDNFEDGSDSENVLQHADTAMYRAKKQGRNCYEFFNPEMHVEASKRLIIEDHLRKAIKNNELTIEFQPIVDTDDEIIGAETLVRWNNPTLGRIPPDEFIAIAEESNLILDLSKWITQHACAFAETLYEALPDSSLFTYISINVSPRQFIQNDFVDSITSIIDSYSIPNEFIKLEFTENVLLDNIDATIEKMKKLHENNIDFLLDDFGTGFSSLSYLHKLPIWLLKIDKSFITDFSPENKDTQAIVNAIMVMTEQLGIKCIIEGVELQDQVDYFKQKGVHGMQGYFYYKSMPGDNLTELLCTEPKKAISL